MKKTNTLKSTISMIALIGILLLMGYGFYYAVQELKIQKQNSAPDTATALPAEKNSDE